MKRSTLTVLAAAAVGGALTVEGALLFPHEAVAPILAAWAGAWVFWLILATSLGTRRPAA